MDLKWKKELVVAIIAQLNQDLDVFMSAAESARVAATHEESQAEDQYDTRGLEASYLAGAQARRVLEIQQLIYSFEHLELRRYTADMTIGPSALVEFESNNKKSLCFIVPKGGTHVDFDGKSIQLVTPASLLGGELINRKAGDEFEVEIAGKLREYKVLSVH